MILTSQFITLVCLYGVHLRPISVVDKNTGFKHTLARMVQDIYQHTLSILYKSFITDPTVKSPFTGAPGMSLEHTAYVCGFQSRDM
jgi:hypothetical protein